MWPPPEQITLEHLFAAWKDQVLITKALAEVDFALDTENEETYDRLLVEGHHKVAELFWNNELGKLKKLDKQLD